VGRRGAVTGGTVRSPAGSFLGAAIARFHASQRQFVFFFKQKTAYEVGLGIPAEPLFRSMRASIKMIGVSNLQSFIASMTQKLTLSDISDESKNYLDKAGITTACLRIKSKWTAGGK